MELSLAVNMNFKHPNATIIHFFSSYMFSPGGDCDN